MPPSDICNWWGNMEVSFDYINSIGQSGGIISFWDTSVFQATTVIKNQSFLAIAGNWHGVLGETIVVNVYAPQAPAEKRIVWDRITNLMNSRQGTWIVLGDFNAVRRPDERFNSNFCPRTATDFNKFILRSGLIDLKMAGQEGFSKNSDLIYGKF